MNRFEKMKLDTINLENDDFVQINEDHAIKLTPSNNYDSFTATFKYKEIVKYVIVFPKEELMDIVNAIISIDKELFSKITFDSDNTHYHRIYIYRNKNRDSVVDININQFKELNIVTSENDQVYNVFDTLLRVFCYNLMKSKDLQNE